jgi:hypothetical protein
MQALADKVLASLEKLISSWILCHPSHHLDNIVENQCVGHRAILLLAEASADKSCSISA